jgi:membrane-associated phospholipid phosphatase
MYEALRIIFSDAQILIIESPLDAQIPFCEWFIIPYVSWYLCIAGLTIFSVFKGKREFYRVNGLIIGCMVLPMIFCTLVPNGIDVAMRPNFETLGRENIATFFVKLIYAADSPPRNVMPSMHVSVSFAMFFAVLRSKFFKKNYIFKTFSGFWAVMIALSTVFIKQHSILDVFAGIGTAVLVFFIVTSAEKLYDKRKIG